MRVTHCLPIFSELTQTFIYELVTNLQSTEDIDTRILTWNRKNVEERPFDPVEEVPPPRRHEIGHLRACRLLPTWMEDRLPLTRFEDNVRKALHTSGTHIAHAQFGPTAVLVSRACRRAGIPLVVTFRGRDASAKLRKWRWRQFYRRTLAHAAAVTCVSPDLCERIRHLLPQETIVQLIPGGKQPRQLAYRPPKPQRGRLISVGRLIDKKGHKDAIRAVAHAREQGADVTLTIVGEGPLGPNLEREIAKHGMEEVVTLTGPLSFEEVVARMREADFLVAASRTGANGDCEGIPNVIKEAQLLGLPIIGTNHGGIPRAIPEPYRTELIAEGDIEALTRRILVMNGLTATEMEQRAQAGRQFVLDHFDPQVEARSYKELYDRVLYQRGTS